MTLPRTFSRPIRLLESLNNIVNNLFEHLRKLSNLLGCAPGMEANNTSRNANQIQLPGECDNIVGTSIILCAYIFLN
uniref:Uncharacterized protein n=1 Tax=Lepeophtheirus salmonis TaxID=72036 RepID=A0A0K2U5C6_LEPSM